MHWTVDFPNGIALKIRWSHNVEISSRLAEYGRFASTVPKSEQELAWQYAQATYVKYRTARDDFATAAYDWAGWKRSRSSGQECLALLEAWKVSEREELAGALLLRSAWTSDIVIDFVGTNFGVTKYARPTFGNVGVVLVAASLSVGEMSDAPLIWVETARHSLPWWDKLLEGGEEFIKVDDVQAAAARVLQLLENQNVRFQTKTT